jgi:hypothetical protein
MNHTQNTVKAQIFLKYDISKEAQRQQKQQNTQVNIVQTRENKIMG